MAQKPIVRISREPARRKRIKGQRARFPKAISWGEQAKRHDAKFGDIESGLGRILSGADLSTSPSEVTPDRALVFEVIGPLSNVAKFVAAVRAAGFEWLGEDFDEDTSDEDEGEEADEPAADSGQSMLYVTMPTIRGLQKVLSLWKQYSTNQPKPRTHDGEWWPLFAYLNDVRTWSAKDRVDPALSRFVDRMMRKFPDRPIRLELDLWFRSDLSLRAAAREYVTDLMSLVAGTVLDFVTIPEIQYQAALVELPNEQALRLGSLQGPLSTADRVMRVRPQSLYTSEAGDAAFSVSDHRDPPSTPDARPAVVALLDGYPVENHVLLRNRLRVSEVDVHAVNVPVARRRHGTAMASLIIHGDLGDDTVPIDRLLQVVPILGAPQNLAEECTPQDQLPLGLVYRAVLSLVEGSDGGVGPMAENVVVINHSICDREAPFGQRASYWAKLLDHLSHRFRLLFIVSAGNNMEPFAVDTYADCNAFETASPVERQIALLSALNRSRGGRIMLSPAETLNGLTVGAVHGDSSVGAPLGFVDPFDTMSGVANLASSVGLGVNRAVKPDIVELGGRQLARSEDDAGFVSAWAIEHPDVGQVTAAPGVGAAQNLVRRSTGTSNAAALTTRTAARLVDVLEDLFDENGEQWLEAKTRAVVLKALLAHGCTWGGAGEILYELYPGGALRKKEAISSVLGYGRPDHSRVFSGQGNRITLLADDIIFPDTLHEYRLPIPRAMVNNRELRRVVVTLAWSSPIDPITRRYRGVRLEVVDGDGKRDFWKGIKRTLSPDGRAARRGTLQHLVFEGKNLIPQGGSGDIFLGVQAMAEMTPFAAAEVPYGLAVTLEMSQPVRTDLFADVEARVRAKRVDVTQRVPTRVRT
ncbi:S8 family serine peptidase [Mesorhizobium escarrei]|uniref:S8 family serine peptidase n=1 Tax=Mesorhizobium escarrei TaxID=666018 RepID=UPI0020A6FB1B|nr:S8 family serine peptidase [Mesorhizobium escarrei]